MDIIVFIVYVSTQGNVNHRHANGSVSRKGNFSFSSSSTINWIFSWTALSCARRKHDDKDTVFVTMRSQMNVNYIPTVISPQRFLEEVDPDCPQRGVNDKTAYLFIFLLRTRSLRNPRTTSLGSRSSSSAMELMILSTARVASSMSAIVKRDFTTKLASSLYRHPEHSRRLMRSPALRWES